MTDSPSIDRLAALTTLASVPREQLEWLAAHGQIRRFDAGQVMFSKGDPHISLYIVLSGRFAIRVERGGVTRVVKEWKAGDISGRLPYSRMNKPPGDVIADDPVELLMIANNDVREMACVCYEFTELCVHEMLDRARIFKSDDLQREKMAALGKLSAGLAHEINNPSSAVVRSAKEMDTCRVEVVAASLQLGAAGLTSEQFAALTGLEATAAKAPKEAHSPLARADREDELGQWFDDHGVDVAPAEPLATTAVTTADLDAVAAVLTGPQLAAALRYVVANVSAGRLTREIENAAGRIHALVAAVKRHTHMDRAPAVEAVQIEGNIGDTFTLLGSKARAKAVTLDLSVEPDLPAVQGVVNELNQLWLNLIDNAIDAAPESGHVTVTAGRERDSVVVRVIDDGAGIAEGDRDRIFEPFFTTKAVGQGTGLGLDIVQGVVRSHKGTLDVHSRPGRTEFRVCLPVAGPR